MHQLVKLCTLFEMQFTQIHYLIYSTLLSGGNISSLTDLLYINEDTILQIENPQITKKYASEFVNYVAKFRRKNTRDKVLLLFDIPGMTPETAQEVLSIQSTEDFIDAVLDRTGTIPSARKYRNDPTCSDLDKHYINFFDYGFNADIFRALVNWK